MGNRCRNTIEFKNITKMPYFTNHEIDFEKIIPIPEALANIYDDHKDEAIIAALTEALSIPVSTFDKKRMEVLREYAVKCFIHQFAWFIIDECVTNPPQDIAAAPDVLRPFMQSDKKDYLRGPYETGNVEHWLRFAYAEEIDKYCLQWAKAKESALATLKDINSLAKTGKTYMENYRTYGAMAWDDWTNKHWGPVYNAFDTEIENENKITFYTDWTLPIPVLKKISANAPDEQLFGQFFDEGGYEGEYIIEHGEVTSWEVSPVHWD